MANVSAMRLAEPGILAAVPAHARQALMFVAFGHSFDAFEVQLRRMVGVDDGISDALFRFTRPLTSGYFSCPPVRDGRLDLSRLL